MRAETEYKIVKKLLSIQKIYNRYLQEIGKEAPLSITITKDKITMASADEEGILIQFNSELNKATNQLLSKDNKVLFDIGRKIGRLAMTMDDNTFNKYKDTLKDLEELVLELEEL